MFIQRDELADTYGVREQNVVDKYVWRSRVDIRRREQSATRASRRQVNVGFRVAIDLLLIVRKCGCVLVGVGVSYPTRCRRFCKFDTPYVAQRPLVTCCSCRGTMFPV